MTFDPYRTLGLRPDATLDEVKRAYRALAKRYHPDRAGEEETARFLAVQAAYEQLLHGRGRVVRGRAAPAPAWQADPERARATREAYRARRARTGWTAEGETGFPAGGRTARPRTGGEPWWRTHPPEGGARASGVGGTAATGPGGQAASGEAADSAAHPSSSGASGPERTAGAGSNEGRRSAGRRRSLHRRKTTLTSTTYDEVKDPVEPDWQGASWYGASSGTFWRINPREYADPRKHGPEYQARARRSTVDDHGAPPDGDTRSGDAARTPKPSGTPLGPADVRVGSALGGSPSTDGARPRAAGRAPSTAGAAHQAASPAARPEPAPRGAATGSGALGAALLAGGVVAVPATVLLLGAGPAPESSALAFAFLAPPLAALVAGLAAIIRSRRWP